jgi:hypothetical protein
MARSTVLGFSETTATMTRAEGLAFIERTRRQLNRFDALPHAPGETISPEEAAAICQQCDELEADIRRSLTTPSSLCLLRVSQESIALSKNDET